MLGAVSAGQLANRLGRKRSLYLNSIFSISAAILMGSSKSAKSIAILIIGRFLIGVNCGAHTVLAPMFLTEIAPLKFRGAFGTANQLFVTIGIFISNFFGLKIIFGTEF